MFEDILDMKRRLNQPRIFRFAKKRKIERIVPSNEQKWEDDEIPSSGAASENEVDKDDYSIPEISKMLAEDLALSSESDDEGSPAPITLPAVIEKECQKLLPNISPKVLDFDITDIYADISKLGAIESYLQLLYRPFLCYVDTECVFNLQELELLLCHTNYEPEKHSALIVHRTIPVCTLKIYATGQIYCKGFSSKGARMGLLNFIGGLEELGYIPLVVALKFNVVNATFSMPFRIDLKQMNAKFKNRSWYNPKNRPFLTFEFRETPIRFAIFPNGFVFVLFAMQPSEVKNAIAFIIPILYRFESLCENVDDDYDSGDITFIMSWETQFQDNDRNSILYS